MGKAPAAAAALILLYGSTAPAQDSAMPNLSFHGYGTFGIVHSDEERADFVPNVFAPEGAGRTSELSAEVDSRFGAQLTAEITPRLSGFVQAVAEQRYNDTYEPKLEWANVEYGVCCGHARAELGSAGCKRSRLTGVFAGCPRHRPATPRVGPAANPGTGSMTNRRVV